MIGNIINDKEVQDKVGYECYDIVAANILAPVLVELAPVIVNQLKPGGIYITSGIIDDKEEMVKEAVAKAGLELGCYISGRMGMCDSAQERIRRNKMQHFFLQIHPAWTENRSVGRK